MNRIITELETPVAKLLVQLDNGWMPADFAMPAFTTLLINQEPWQGDVLSVQLETAGVLVFKLQSSEEPDFERFSNKRLTATSAENGSLEAREHHITIHYGSPAITEVRCRNWSYTPPAKPVLWVAHLQGVEEVKVLGNLLTYRKEGNSFNASSTGIRLTTEKLAIYILNTKLRGEVKQALIAFESLTDQQLTPDAIEQELRLLRVVLSTTMQPQLLSGLNADAQTIGTLSANNSQASQPVSNRGMSPVPIFHSDVANYSEGKRVTWLAPFYEKLRPFYLFSSEANAVAFSITRYANSLAPLDIDTQFELVAGAVWILSNYFSRPHTNDGTGNQSNDYRSSIGLDALNWLATRYGPDGELVGQELLAAVNELVHGTLPDYQQRESMRDSIRKRYNRVQRLRRAYAVLLGQAIGYQGPLNEFEALSATPFSPRLTETSRLDSSRLVGWLQNPPIAKSERATALTTFRASADVTGLSVWPTFELPTLPQDELVKRFASFAEQIRPQTQGKVSARLRPMPHRNDGPTHISFRLMVDQTPTTQVALFTMELLKKGFEVQGWSDKPIRITTPKSLDNFQRTLLTSPDFKYQIERLLLIEDDIRRGEA